MGHRWWSEVDEEKENDNVYQKTIKNIKWDKRERKRDLLTSRNSGLTSSGNSSAGFNNNS